MFHIDNRVILREQNVIVFGSDDKFECVILAVNKFFPNHFYFGLTQLITMTLLNNTCKSDSILTF